MRQPFAKLFGTLKRPRGFRSHIDFLTRQQIIGWAFDVRHGLPLTIEAWIGGQCVGRALANEPRTDVATIHSQAPGSARCGFHLPLVLPGGLEELVELHVYAAAEGVPPEAARWVLFSQQIPSAVGLSVACDAAAESSGDGLFPFPRGVTDAIIRLWPELAADLDTDAGQERAAQRILLLASFDEGSKLPLLLHYIRFLRMTWAHFEYVGKFFPKLDSKAPPGSKDARCTPNSTEEMFSIAHQLYVLKSYGVNGHFAEFGCFKGFSSALLSYACDYLGIPMIIYDSFEGLPASNSAYYQEGDFRGSFEEVQRNIEQFGVPRAVSYRKGYFSQTVSAETVPDLMCLWMDVDLESSSSDIMRIAHKVHEKGCVFTHECGKDNFVCGRIVAVPGPDSVLPPILERYSDSNRQPLSGRHIAGYTGALWKRQIGLPVLANSALLTLVRGR
jgi:hypothetical protein